MTSDNPLSHCLKVTTLVALGTLVFGGQNALQAAEFDCGAMADSLNPGDRYVFKLEIQSKMMRLEKGDDFCTEPAKEWFRRQLILPPPAREEMPLPKKPASQLSEDNTPLPGSPDDTPLPGQRMRQGLIPDMGLETDNGAVPLPIQRKFVKPKKEGAAVDGASEKGTAQADPAGKSRDHVSSDPNSAGADGVPGAKKEIQVYGVAAPPPPKRDDSLVKRCDRDLTSFWSPGEHQIDGQKFWLSGVFTIDLDSDGRVDDVGFKIKSEGKIGNILNYFPSTEGRYSGKTIDSLKLDDDRDIHRLCPGNITFERVGPAAIAKKKQFTADRVKALAKDGGKKAETPEDAAPEKEPPKKKTSIAVLVVAGFAMAMLLAGGIGLAMALRNIARSRKDEYEDDDDDEDEDEA